MDKKDLEKLLMRFSHLGVTHSKNGALLIGKAPHIAEYAWLNIMYPCITEAEVCDLEKKLGQRGYLQARRFRDKQLNLTRQ